MIRVKKYFFLNLANIWGTSANSLYAAGSGGVIIHYEGNQWTEFMSPSRQDLYGIWGSQDDHILVVVV
ncbi:conserved hypothetical protein, secreted [Candidatus Magnetomorum sp. HK-1]|nr:conserved hypothetical protein, secreted [Candidatus Magnetomorum sp. HK-1]